MLAFIKRRQFTLALLIPFLFASLLSFFTLARNRKPATTTARDARTNAAPATRTLANAPAHRLSLDSDNDGIPDSAELQTFMDRENFRQWFTAIAEGQFYQLSEQWNNEQRDCAGLVRFGWREALRRHDRLWFQKMGPGYTAVAPDVKHYSLEQGPLGEKLFRTSFGSYKDGELGNGTFSEFADARSLKNFNTRFISRDRRRAEPGDLLFFYQPWVQKFPYHVMIFLGPARVDSNQASDWVVYHTGSSPIDQGTVKKVELAVLDHHPNKRWRPLESNTNFLGFYRLKILD
ncbi:MAG: uncharacterized protein QOD33_1210 [Pyrinomonadaceae bacterium]|jgi:uncharacterized protein YfaT (DUF1175 family)|nr:uncharacterized protein [Pyrinomonadaceae bacterium]